MSLSVKYGKYNRAIQFLLLFILMTCQHFLKANATLPDSIYRKTVTIEKGYFSMESIFKKVEKQTRLKFSYTNRILPDKKIYFIGYENLQLGFLLDRLMFEYGLTANFINPDIIIINRSKKSYKETMTISGFVADSATGEKLIGANIYISRFSVGTVTNTDGFFSITVPLDSFILKVSYIGFSEKLFNINGNNNAFLDVQLSGLKLLAAIEISDENLEREGLITKTNEKIRIKGIRLDQSPMLLGETDVFRMLQLLPGIQSVGEGTPGLFVRGGSADQNLILLDGVPVYNPVHIFGFFSVFNPSIVKDVQVSKGAFPARYGGRLSSVVEVSTKEGNSKKIGGEVSLGIIGAKILLEGPVIKDKTTFCLAARRSYVDLLLSPFFSPNTQVTNTGFFSGYHFLDINAKLVHRFNNKSKLIFNFYNGRDKVSIRNSFSQQDPLKVQVISENDRQDYRWGNTLFSSTWSQLIGKKSILRTTFWYNFYSFGNRSQYSYISSDDTGNTNRSYDYSFYSNIKDYGVSSDWDFRPVDIWSIRIGGQFISHTFEPSVISLSSDLSGLIPPLPVNNPVLGNEMSGYIENQINLGSDIFLNIGTHHTLFTVSNRTYGSVQPRIQLVKKWKKRLSLSIGYSEMQQFLHLLTNSTIGIPNDLWVPATAKVAPQYNKQWNGGIKYDFKSWSFSADVFYKDMYNVIEYKDEVNYLNSPEGWEDKITLGKGIAKGVEFSIEKTIGKTTGWLGYCISGNTRYFDEINNGHPFPFRYDRLHDLSITVTHKIKDRITLSANFIYATGNAITLPNQIYPGISHFDPFTEIYLSGDRNSYRMPAYHRLDLNANFIKNNRFGERMWSFGLYNAYNRMNPFYISPGYSVSGKRILRQVTLFPIIPSITFKQKF